MSRSNEFLQFTKYSALEKKFHATVQNSDLKQLSEQERYERTQEAYLKVMKTKAIIKQSYHMGELQFKTWYRANKEFIKALSKAEKQQLITLEKAYNESCMKDDNAGTEEIIALFNYLADLGYSTFINEYIEDYEIN